MWIATRNGVATYKNGKIEKVIKTEDGLPDNWVISLAVDKNDNIWFYTPIGLTRYNGDSFITYTQEDGLVRPRRNGDISIDKKETSSCLLMDREFQYLMEKVSRI